MIFSTATRRNGPERRPAFGPGSWSWLTGIAVATVFTLGLAAGALAQSKPAKAPKPEELDFEGDVVETSFLKPDASLVEGEARKGGTSLLKIRRDFIPEIVRSAEDI